MIQVSFRQKIFFFSLLCGDYSMKFILLSVKGFFLNKKKIETGIRERGKTRKETNFSCVRIPHGIKTFFSLISDEID